MSFSKKTFESTPYEPYYANDRDKIREIAKKELLKDEEFLLEIKEKLKKELLKDEEFLLEIKEKLKAEIKNEILSEIKSKQQD